MHSLFIDEMISERSNGQTRFRLNDHLGSLRKLTNGSGITTESLTYDAFGEPSSTSSSRFLFTGRERDSETGLYYYRARTYQPSLGRFMSKDPLEFLKNGNAYGYVSNRPVSEKDPLGLVGEGDFERFLRENFGDRLTPTEINQASKAMSDNTNVFQGLDLKNAQNNPKKMENELQKLKERLEKNAHKLDPPTRDALKKIDKLAEDAKKEEDKKNKKDCP